MVTSPKGRSLAGREWPWRDRRLHSPHQPGRYFVELTERGVPHLTVGVRTWLRDGKGRGGWLDENGTAEGVFLDDCDWFVLSWRDLPSIAAPLRLDARGKAREPSSVSPGLGPGPRAASAQFRFR